MNVNGSSVGTLTVNGIETMAVTTATAASIIDSVVSNTLKAVTVAGDQALTLGSIANGTGLTLTDVTDANTVDASAMTAALNLNLLNDNAVDVEVSTGSANDTVAFVSFDTDDTFDGNEGTDTISLTNATAIARTTTNGGTLTDVEQLLVRDAGTGIVDMDAFSGVTKVIFDADITAAATSTVDDAVTGITVEVDTTATTGTLVVDLKTDGTADVVTVQLDDVAAGEAITSIDAADAETLNISADDDTTNGVGAMTITSLTATDATTLNLSGDADLDVTLANVATPVLSTVNASTMTGDVTITAADLKATGATVTLGLGDDVLDFAGSTAAGADTIDLSKGGNDTVIYQAAAQSSGLNSDTITGFTTGDVINLKTLTAGAVTNSSLFLGNAANTTAAETELSGTVGEAVYVVSDGALVVDVNGDGDIGNGDLRVYVKDANGVALTSMVAADLGFTAGNTLTLTSANGILSTTGNTYVAGATAADYTTNEDDTINTTYSVLVGATAAITGGLGDDTLNVSGDAAALTNLNVSAGAGVALTGIENVVFDEVNGIMTLAAIDTDINNITLNGINAALAVTFVANGQTLTVNNTSGLNNSAITFGVFTDQVATTGSAADTFTIAGNDDLTANGGAGIDTFNATVAAFDNDAVLTTIIGGTGVDVLNIAAVAALSTIDFSDATDSAVSGVETLTLGTNTATLALTLADGTGFVTLNTDLSDAAGDLTVNGTGAQLTALTTITSTVDGVDADILFAVSDAGATLNWAGAAIDAGLTGAASAITFTGNNNTLALDSADLAEFDTVTAAGTGDTLNLGTAGANNVLSTNYDAFENITATGTAAVNIQDAGTAVVRTITGNSANNTIDIQTTAVNTVAKTVALATGGTDTVMIHADTVATNLITISGFGSTDVIDLDITAVTSASVVAASATVTEAAADTATNMYILNTAASQITGLLTDTGNDAGVEQALQAAALTTTAGVNGTEFYVAMDNGTDTGIYCVAITQGGTAGLLDLAAETTVVLVGTLSGVVTSDLSAANFS